MHFICWSAAVSLLFWTSLSHAANLNAIATISSLVSDSFSVGIPVQVQLQFATPPTSSPYTAIIEWGEWTAQGAPAVTTVSSVTTALVSRQYTYATTGIRTVNVTVSTGSVTWLNSAATDPSAFRALDSDGSLSRTVSMVINVKKQPDTCYQYSASVKYFQDRAPSKALFAHISLNIIDPTNAQTPVALTSTLASFGHLPQISVANDTTSLVLEPLYQPDNQTWTVVVPSAWFLSPSEVSLFVDPQSAVVFGCAVSPAVIPVSPFATSSASWGISSLLSVPAPSSPLTQLKLVKHPCRPAQAFALLSPTASSNAAFVTTDAWASSTAYPLATALCGTSCPNGFTVYDVHFTALETVLYATSNGLYQSTSSFRSARRLTTGISALDAPTSTVQFANRGCFSELIVATTSTRAYWSVIGLPAAWTESSALPAGSTLVSTLSWESDLPGQAPRILIANASNALQVLDATTGAVLSSSFPPGISFTPGTPALVVPHIDGREIFFMLGSTALVSDDAGQSWRLAFRSPGASNHIKHAVTSRTRNAIAALTSQGNILVGRSGTLGAAQVPGLARFNGANAPPISLTYDTQGTLYVLYAASQDGSTVSLSRSRVGSIEASVGTPGVGGPAAALAWPANVAIAAVPTGVNSWQLVAVNAATGGVVPGTWQETDEGMSIAHASKPGVTMSVLRVSDDGSAALVQALGSIATLSSLSAMGSAMNVVAGGSAGVVNLVLTAAGQAWVSSVIGSTVIVNGVHAVYVTTLVDAQTARGVLVSPASALALPVTGTTTWRVIDFRAAFAHGVPATQTFAVTATGSSNVGDVLSIATNTGAGHLQFGRVFVDMFIVVDSGQAVVKIVTCPSATSATGIVVANSMSGLVGTTFNANRVAITRGDYLGPTSLHWRRAWFMSPPSCPLQSLSMTVGFNDQPISRANLYAQYMSSTDQLTLNATARWIPENPTIIQRGQAVGGLSSQLTYSDWFGFNLSSEADNDRLNSKSDLSIRVDNREEMMAPLLEASATRSLRSLVSVSPAPLSLMCPFSVPTIRVVSGCNPSYRLVVTIPGTSFTTLEDDLVFSNGASMIQSLPTNYRPPSTLGVAVPNSTYIYNADPSAPRYNDFFPISQSTGTFQQCLGESSRAGCACIDDQKRSMSVADSDCIEMVMRAYQQSTFSLKLQLTRDMITYKAVSANFTVTELNHRTDWCVTSVAGACTTPDWSYSALADPSQNASIQFKGGELYHFRASVPIGTYCTLRADFPVYVINSTPLPSVHQSAMAISAIVFCFWLLTIYLWYSYKQA